MYDDKKNTNTLMNLLEVVDATQEAITRAKREAELAQQQLFDHLLSSPPSVQRAFLKVNYRALWQASNKHEDSL